MFAQLKRSWLAIFFLAALLLGACNLPKGTTPTQPDDPGMIHTIAAQTVEAQLTQAAAGEGTTPQPVPASPTPTTPAPNQIDDGGGVQPGEPSATPTHTPTEEIPPTPTNTPTPSPTSTEVPCDQMSFVKDVSIPDDTELQPGEEFKKTWRIKNTGSCTWTSGYSLAFDSGDAMGAPASIPVTAEIVAPNQEVDVSVDLTAPDDPGTYRGNFKIRNPGGVLFGWGDESKPFWVQIVVPEVTGVMFDFISQASSAKWGSGVEPIDFAGPGHTVVTFGGPDDDVDGSAMIKDNVLLENGGTSGKLLETRPKNEDDGYIVGRFPEYKVGLGDHIQGRLGFIANADGSCGAGNAVYEIHYVVGNDLGTRTRLAQWHKICDGTMLPIDVDLEDLKGKTVQFYLVVMAHGKYNKDWAVWSSLGVMR